MDDKTLEALKGSIAKWEAIVAGDGVDLGSSNCPLCRMFLSGGCCKGCPVFHKTGKRMCDGTPYMEYAEGDDDAAQAEVDFLKSLLPPEVSDG